MITYIAICDYGMSITFEIQGYRDKIFRKGFITSAYFGVVDPL